MLESIETLNDRLVEVYGREETNKPIWRVVWSDDQFENRLVDSTDDGIVLLFPEIRRVPKYYNIRERYVLEQLVIVPEVNAKELGTKLSYEPLFVFENANGPLPPKWEAIQFIIYNVHLAKGKVDKSKRYFGEYDGVTDPKEIAEIDSKRIAKLQEELFGNESDIGDALAYKEGVSVPSNYKVN